MRFGGRGSVLLLLLAAVVLLRPWETWVELGQAESPRSVSSYVARVVDGDTVEVELDGEIEDVRYIGVDTPETVKPEEPVECFGPQASSFNHRLVEFRRERLVFDRERRDQYGRLLAYVYLGDRFVNAELVRRGLARTLTIPPNDRFAERLKRLEIAAARSGRGLWGAC
ncbi:MAG TPA: thermonuclease family protein [Solirubrobacterales bacterium]